MVRDREVSHHQKKGRLEEKTNYAADRSHPRKRLLPLGAQALPPASLFLLKGNRLITGGRLKAQEEKKKRKKVLNLMYHVNARCSKHKLFHLKAVTKNKPLDTGGKRIKR